jgi:uncharacterized protein with ParB-like and HNH nuclease domain
MEIINIDPKKMKDLLSSDEQILVPSYQRRFSWKEKHFRDLWNDLQILGEKDVHFFGTIVFMSRTHIAQETNRIEVVDGQQRITTISIMLCAMRDFLKKEYGNKVEESRIEKIEECLWLIDLDGNKKGKRIILGNLDKESYNNLIESKNDEVENEKLREAYDYFYKKIKNLASLEEIKKLHKKILMQLLYVAVTTKGHKDAYQLFEAMNNRGLVLSPIDLMKNYLFMKASEKCLDEKKIEKLWGDIIQNLDRIFTINEPAVTFFRQYFMSSKLLSINEKITESKLYDPTFKVAIDRIGDIERLLRDVREQAILYRKLLNGEIDMFDKSKNVEINRLLKDVRVVSVTPFTLLLSAFRELKNVEDIKEVMRMANVLLVRRSICGWNTGPHDTYFNHLAQNAFKKENPLKYIKEYLSSEGRLPADEHFKDKFVNEKFPETDKTRYYLGKIEEEHFGHGGKEVVESRYKVHIEHILPKTYSKNLVKLWLKPYGISREEHKEFKERIGNLTLLEKLPNLSASNRCLEKKQEYYKNKTDMIMTRKLIKYKKWGISEIKRRSENLAEIAAKIWSLN